MFATSASITFAKVNQGTLVRSGRACTKEKSGNECLQQPRQKCRHRSLLFNLENLKKGKW